MLSKYLFICIIYIGNGWIIHISIIQILFIAFLTTIPNHNVFQINHTDLNSSFALNSIYLREQNL